MSLILVDTSIWVRLLSRKSAMLQDSTEMERYATCPPIIQEVLQGIRSDLHHSAVKDGLLALPCLSDPIDSDAYLHASDLYRSGRRRGLTIRSAVDCLIAAVAIRSNVAVWHSDRDFDEIAKFSDLKIHDGR